MSQLKTTKFLFSIVAFSFCVLFANDAFGSAGRTGAAILNLGGGTRAASLGDAFSAISDDASSIFWNPSGLGDLTETETIISFTDRSQLFGEASADMYYAFFAGATQVDGIGSLAASLQIEGQGTIDVTADSPDILRTENLGTNWVLTFSYADQIMEGLSAGVSGKIIRQKLAQYGGRAYAVDFGGQYDIPNVPVPIRLGVAVQNWGTRIKFKDENQSDPLPRVLRFGTLITLLNSNNHQIHFIGDLTVAIDKLREDDEEGIEIYLKENPDVTRDGLMSDRGVGINAFQWRHLQRSFGLEYMLGKILSLRIGYKKEPGIKLLQFSDHVTYGFGVRLGFGQIDYAQIPGGGPNNKRLNVVALKFIF